MRAIPAFTISYSTSRWSSRRTDPASGRKVERRVGFRVEL
jgi:hypothetical protein